MSSTKPEIAKKDIERLSDMWKMVSEILMGLCGILEQSLFGSEESPKMMVFNDPNDDCYLSTLTSCMRISARNKQEGFFISECLRTLYTSKPIFLLQMCETFRTAKKPFDPLDFMAFFDSFDNDECFVFAQNASGPLKYDLERVKAEVIPTIAKLDMLLPLGDDEPYSKTFARSVKYLEGVFNEIADLSSKEKAKKEKHAKNSVPLGEKLEEEIEEKERKIKEMEAKLERLNEKLVQAETSKSKPKAVAKAKPSQEKPSRAKPAEAVAQKESDEEPEKMKMSKVCINAIELLLHKKKKTKSFSVKAIQEVIAESTDGEVPVERVQKGLDKAVKKGLLEEKKGLYSMVKK